MLRRGWTIASLPLSLMHISLIDPLGLWTYQMGFSMSWAVAINGVGFGYTGRVGFAIDGNGNITTYGYRGPGGALGTPGISGGVHAAVFQDALPPERPAS